MPGQSPRHSTFHLDRGSPVGRFTCAVNTVQRRTARKSQANLPANTRRTRASPSRPALPSQRKRRGGPRSPRAAPLAYAVSSVRARGRGRLLGRREHADARGRPSAERAAREVARHRCTQLTGRLADRTKPRTAPAQAPGRT